MINYESLGCVDFGNDNFYEIWEGPNGALVSSHDEDPELEESYMSVSEFLKMVEVECPEHYQEVVEQVQELMSA